MAGRKYLPIALLALVLLPNALGKPDDHEPSTYDVVDDSGQVCMTFELAAEFSVDYLTTENTTRTAAITLPAANDTGTSMNDSRCLNRTDGFEGGLIVTFGDGFFFGILITVSGKDNDVDWTVNAVRLGVNVSDSTYFENATDQSVVGFETTEADIHSDGDSGYSCSTRRTLDMYAVNATGQPEPGQLGARVTFWNLTMNPFNSTDLSSCEPSHDKSKSHSRIVPIAVGSALAGLLLLVVVAYVINRRSSKRGGYEKV